MTSRLWLPGALLLVSTAPLCSQQLGSPSTSPGTTPNIVQPGAPGHDSRTLPSATAASATAIRTPSEADVKFMQGMIMHHNQAVEMTALIKSHTSDPEVQNIGNRISISQTDEMRFMKQWLTDRGLALPATMDMSHMDHSSMAGMDMAGMDMSHDNHKTAGMDAMPAMPGMLTPPQMEALRAAKGPVFDHLFLTGMIQHHTGALTMVKDLLANPGAAQDPVLFDFASDVDNTQLAEIDFMKTMLNAKQTKEKQ